MVTGAAAIRSASLPHNIEKNDVALSKLATPTGKKGRVIGYS